MNSIKVNLAFGFSTLFFLSFSFISWSQSEILISPSLININFDTIGIQSRSYQSEFNLNRFEIKFRIINNSLDSIALIDSLLRHIQCAPAIIPPNGKATLSMTLGELMRLEMSTNRIGLDSFLIHFAKTGKMKCATKSAQLVVNFSFGKSKMIEVERPIRNLNTKVEKLVREKVNSDDTATYEDFSKVNIIEYLELINSSNKTFILPVEAYAWNDTGNRIDYFHGKGKPLRPLSSTDLEIQLNMARKKIFDVYGFLIIHSDDYSDIELIFTRFESSFADKR